MKISLTTISSRIDCCSKTIKSLLNQSVKCDIHLFISKNPYLLDEGFAFNPFSDFPITVHFVDNIGPYRKFLPIAKMFPNEKILVVDDDTIYHPCFVEFCINNSTKADVVAFRANYISLSPYKDWAIIDSPTTSNNVFHKGNGGVVYNTAKFQFPEFYEKYTISETNDDIFFNFWRIKKEISTLIIPLNDIHIITNHQPKRLHFINEKTNDEMIANIKMLLNI